MNRDYHYPAAPFENFGLYNGRMIGGSKSLYIKKHPNNQAIFNANVVVKSVGKVFYGDVDLAKDSETLQKICNLGGKELLVLREMDCRFDNEGKSYEEYEKVAVKKFTPQA